MLLLGVTAIMLLLAAFGVHEYSHVCPECQKKMYFWQATRQKYIGPINVGFGGKRGGVYRQVLSLKDHTKMVHSHH
jgi:hypothetical protein